MINLHKTPILFACVIQTAFALHSAEAAPLLEGAYQMTVYSEELNQLILKSQTISISSIEGKPNIKFVLKEQSIESPLIIAKIPGSQKLRFASTTTVTAGDFDSLIIHGEEQKDGTFGGSVVFHGWQFESGAYRLVTLTSSFQLKYNSK